MKKILALLLLSTASMNAQKIIIQDTYEKSNKPVSYGFGKDLNSIIIYKGKKIGGLVAGSKTTGIYSYDFNGTKTVIAEGKEYYDCGFSPSGNTLRGLDISGGIFKTKDVFIKDGKFSDPYPTEQNEPYSHVFPYYANFTDQYTLVLKNAVNQQKYNYGKDVFYNLIRTDNYTHKKSKVKVVPPDSKRITAPGMVRPEKNINFRCSLNSDDTFSMVTKSILADYTKTTYYLTTYNLDGSQVSEKSYEMTMDPGFYFVYSNNGSGFTETSAVASDPPFFDDDLFINGAISDKDGNSYFYGLYSDKACKLNDEVKPKGYYVYKFDKSGKQIWKSIQPIDDKDFNDKHYMYFTETDLSILKDQLCFYSFTNEHKEFVHYALLNKETGAVANQNKIMFHEYQSRVGVGSDFFKLNFEIEKDKELKDKKFNVKGIISLEINKSFSNYVRKVEAKNETHFLVNFTSKGLIVLETDNDDYYKAIYFE
jgi:hypothetical protein